MVNVAQLIKSIERIAWKAGTHENVRHEIDAVGNHRIVVLVPARVAEWKAPEHATSPADFRGTSWADIKPPPRPPGKSKT